MKRYALLFGIMLGAILGTFAIVEMLAIPILTDPGPLLQRGGLVAGFTGVALLVLDVVLPVPSSLIMIAHGAIFGFWLGALLSLVGSLGAGLVAFAIGRRCSPLFDRFIPTEARARGDAILARWGDVAIIVTRPIPVLAETVAISAGASSMTWRRMTLSTCAGATPMTFCYALFGAIAVSTNNMFWVFAAVSIMTGIYWIVERGSRSQQQAVQIPKE